MSENLPAKLGGKKRSPKWPAARRAWLKKHPKCAVCLRVTKCAVHHVMVFHKRPDLELNQKNFITLCEGTGTGNHHLWWGHLGNFKSWNETVREDVKYFREKILKRPL